MNKFSLRTYLKDKWAEGMVFIVVIFTTISFCLAFRLRIEIIIVLITPMLLAAFGMLLYDYGRKKRFYETLRTNLEKLDQAYLVTETIERPSFLDGQMLHDACYEIDKSMLENLGKLARQNQDFREYIELWIHEIKTPLTALTLLAASLDSPELQLELARVENLAEQVLYFVRAESAEADYLLGECKVGEVIKTVLHNYRTQIQSQNVDIVVENLNQIVYSDAKWLQFVISQILANALKYGAKVVQIVLGNDGRVRILKIRDDGVGIAKEDLPRIFDKTFTGKNGRGGDNRKSTGIGLYLVKILCDKLGHQIQISSKTGKNSYTEVEIRFGEHDYYKNVC